MWINTVEFSPVATGKEVCNAHPKSLEMKEWVTTQLDRIKNGYDVCGQHITGDMYFFLNFYKLIDKNTKKYKYPTFLDFQADFCKWVEEARRIHKGLVCVKRRQVGFTELLASIIIRELWFNDASQILMATDGADQIKPLIKNTSNFINELNQTPIRKNLRIDTPTFKKLGYQLRGENFWRGQSSELHARNFTKGNHMVAVGMTPSMVVVDEAGKASGLIDFYEYVRPSITNMEGLMTGLPIIFGATGEMEKSKDLKLMFYEPEKYNMLSFEYEGETTKTGYFVEGWRMRVLDENGNSNKELGIKSILEDRENVKSNNDERALLSAISQYPLIPKEAFLDRGANIFNTLKIQNHIDNLSKSNLLDKLKVGEIENFDGKLQFIETSSYMEMVKNEKDIKGNKFSKGRFIMYEEPEYVDDKIPQGKYIIGADPYHLDEGSSLGAIYVYKRMMEGGVTQADLPVCEYLYRPSNTSLFAEDVLKLCKYYNAIAMVEPSTNVVKDYFWHHGMLKYLAFTPRIATNDLSKGSNVKYGFPINTGTKSYAMGLISTYIDNHIENIYFPRLLKEMLDYDGVSNFDLLMAYAQVMVYRSELWDMVIRKPLAQKQMVLPKWKYIEGKRIRIQ